MTRTEDRLCQRLKLSGKVHLQFLWNVRNGQKNKKLPFDSIGGM